MTVTPTDAPDAPDYAAPDTVHRIALAEIDPDALPRDRTGLVAEDLGELINSICISGLRMPIEVFPLEAPRQPAEGPAVRWGLLSGYRRYEAYARIHADEVASEAAQQPFAAIPAFIRPRAARADQLVQLVEENAIRSDLSPWEQGRIACHAWRRGVFASIDEAVSRLYVCAHRMKRARIRAIAKVVEELDGFLTTPEYLNQRQILRLSHAVEAGFGDVMRITLEESSRTSPEAQWELILPYLLEAEQPPLGDAPKPRPGYPRRVARVRPGLTIRREWTPEGYILHFTGKEAHGVLICDIIDEIERQWGRG